MHDEIRMHAGRRRFRTRWTDHSRQKGLRHALVTENKSVRRVEILNEIGNQAVIANDEPGEGGGSREAGEGGSFGLKGVQFT